MTDYQIDRAAVLNVLNRMRNHLTKGRRVGIDAGRRSFTLTQPEQIDVHDKTLVVERRPGCWAGVLAYSHGQVSQTFQHVTIYYH